MEPLLIPPRPRQGQAILNTLSRAAGIKQLDARAQANFLYDVQVDDEIAEVAYQRGLLATFVVSPPSMATGSVPPFQVEAPEFASVEYLKRRITKEKLLLSNEYYVPDRFTLKQAHFPGRDEDEEIKELDEKMPSTNIPMLLFNLGYRGGETYHVTILSRARTNDQAQQQNMIAAAAAAAPRFIPLEDPVARQYQDLLHAHATMAAQAQAPAAPASRQDPVPELQPQYRQVEVAVGPAPLPSPEVIPGHAMMNVPGEAPRSPRRNRPGRWSAKEIESLVGAIQTYKYNWAQIKVACGDNIHELRTTIDLKDKWRNLVKVCRDPSKVIRSVGISDGMKEEILRIAMQMEQI